MFLCLWEKTYLEDCEGETLGVDRDHLASQCRIAQTFMRGESDQARLSKEGAAEGEPERAVSGRRRGGSNTVRVRWDLRHYLYDNIRQAPLSADRLTFRMTVKSTYATYIFYTGEYTARA